MKLCNKFRTYCAMFLLVVMAFAIAEARAEVIACNSTTIVEVVAGDQACPMRCDVGYSCQPDAVTPPIDPPTNPPSDFLANYTNPEQEKVPADGIYPQGQRMPISGYASSEGQMRRMAAAGFAVDGPHYHGGGQWMMKHWEQAEALGVKNYFRLREVGGGALYWTDLFELMETAESRANLKARIIAMVNSVQDDPKLNSNIFAWYGFQEEPIYRSNTPIAKQREYHVFVHNAIKETDRKKRPYYISERSDSSQPNMSGNACMQDGVHKQNYLIKANNYGGDTSMRYLMHQWALDQVKTAEDADNRCPSYTGKKRATISTLSMYIDPEAASERNETWLRKAITHDVYTQLAAGIDGFALYAWSTSGDVPQTTKQMQEDIYIDVLGQIAKSGLGKAFLWGDDRDDLTLTITSGPETIRWKKYSNWFTAPSISMRNIQHGNNRYILLVNESKEVIKPRVSGFPSGLKIVDMIPNKTYDLGESINPTIQPLGVRMYRVERR